MTGFDPIGQSRTDQESSVSISQQASSLAIAMAVQWEQGSRWRTEDVLHDYPEIARSSKAGLRILYEEICLRLDEGESLTADQLATRFPDWRRDIEMLLQCHQLLGSDGPSVEFPIEGDDFCDFRILRELGRGVHGRVYLADQPYLAGRWVVLKVTQRMGQEHLQLARLQHTNIVPLYSARDLPELNLRYLCMPYLGGATLGEILELIGSGKVLARSGDAIVEALDRFEHAKLGDRLDAPGRRLLHRMTLEESICWLGVCLADALHHAHDQGMIHLDLKPSNVLVASDGRPMLLDFHLARRPLPAGAIADWIGGTPAYMSPEQYLAWKAIREGSPVPDTVDARSDIFSLGVVLREAFVYLASTRHVPEKGTDALDHLPVGLQDILRKCVEASPSRRYPTAAAVAGDLRLHLQNLPLRGVRNRSLSERIRKWRRRRPQALSFGALAASIALALVTIGVMFFNRYREAESILRDGSTLLEARRYSRANDMLQRGVALTRSWPIQTQVGTTLEEEANRARCVVYLQRFREQIDRLRYFAAEEGVRSEALRQWETNCAAAWNERDKIRRALKDPLLEERQQELRADILDFAVLWIDLRSRLANLAESQQVHQFATSLLEEVDKLVGLNDLLRRELEAHRTNTSRQNDLVLDPAKPDGAETAWQHFVIGRRLLNVAEFDHAASHFSEAIQHQPDDFWSWFYRGIACYRMKQFEDSIQAFTVAVALRPSSPECVYNRGLTHGAAGHNREALADYGRALQLSPSFGAAAINRGVLHFRDKNLVEAEKDFQLAMSSQDSRPAAYLNLAMVLEARGDRMKAEETVEQALKYRPDFTEALRLKAKLANP